jgi:transmembrane 9 superfamily protein 3
MHLKVQIHWFSIFNSFMMVIFLTGLVSMILMRTLRNDYAKYAREDDDLVESLVMLLYILI